MSTLKDISQKVQKFPIKLDIIKLEKVMYNSSKNYTNWTSSDKILCKVRWPVLIGSEGDIGSKRGRYVLSF